MNSAHWWLFVTGSWLVARFSWRYSHMWTLHELNQRWLEIFPDLMIGIVLIKISLKGIP